MKESRGQIVRVYLIYISMVAFAILVLGRICYLQYVQGPELKVEAEKATLKLRTVKAPLGNIYADNAQKTTLALSVPRYNIYMDLKTVNDQVFDQNIAELAKSLAQLFGNKSAVQWENELREEEDRNTQYHLIKKSINNEQLQQLKTFPIFNLGQNKGGLIENPFTRRVLPYGELARRTIGYYREEDNVRVGLEGAYHKYLMGQDGEQLMEKIRGGIWKPIESKYSKEPIPGADVYTSIDINIQDVAHAALLKQLRDQSAARGCAVLMEVNTGYIKAIANLTRDPETGKYYETQNHAVGMASEPGSTFKLASILVALEDDKIRISDSVDMTGHYSYYGNTLKDPVTYGKNTVQFAFEKSSNVISKIINENYKSDPQKFVDGIKKIGIDQSLGLPIVGEGKPLIKDVKDPSFSGISLPWMAIGYEVLQTPLQTLTLYNAVANNGVMVKPQFVKEIRQGSEVVEKFDPIIINPQICSIKTLMDLKKLLEGVVERGTAKNIKARGFSIAGKTGTAKIASGGVYSDKYQASFCGYFPAEKPKYSCVVVIQGPTKQIYGSVVSGTVFKEIADKVYASDLENTRRKATELIVEEDDPYPFSKNGSKKELAQVFKCLKVPFLDLAHSADFVVSKTGIENVELHDRAFDDERVPNVVGMGLVDAIYIMESNGLEVKIKGSGVVKSQSIDPGAPLVKGKMITLNLI